MSRRITTDALGNHHIRLRPIEWWDHAIWWRTYTPGGYDGYRTITGRRLPCQTMADALCQPDWRDEIRQLARKRKGPR